MRNPGSLLGLQALSGGRIFDRNHENLSDWISPHGGSIDLLWFLVP
jgi:hypothetical protein